MRSVLPLGTRTGSFTWLLMSLLVLLIAGSVLADTRGGEALSHVLIGITLVASLYSVSHSRGFLWTGGALATVTYGALSYAYVTESGLAQLAGYGAGCVFYLAAALAILVRVLLKTRISTDELAGAVSVYLLIGIGGAFVFAFIEHLAPASIVDMKGLAPPRRALGEYLYFSFTCLTTLGFGDLVPASPQARVFAYLEAVIGQVYLTVLVARLVGLHLTQFRAGGN